MNQLKKQIKKLNQSSAPDKQSSLLQMLSEINFSDLTETSHQKNDFYHLLETITDEKIKNQCLLSAYFKTGLAFFHLGQPFSAQSEFEKSAGAGAQLSRLSSLKINPETIMPEDIIDEYTMVFMDHYHKFDDPAQQKHFYYLGVNALYDRIRKDRNIRVKNEQLVSRLWRISEKIKDPMQAKIVQEVSFRLLPTELNDVNYFRKSIKIKAYIAQYLTWLEEECLVQDSFGVISRWRALQQLSLEGISFKPDFLKRINAVFASYDRLDLILPMPALQSDQNSPSTSAASMQQQEPEQWGKIILKLRAWLDEIEAAIANNQSNFIPPKQLSKKSVKALLKHLEFCFSQAEAKTCWPDVLEVVGVLLKKYVEAGVVEGRTDFESLCFKLIDLYVTLKRYEASTLLCEALLEKNPHWHSLKARLLEIENAKTIHAIYQTRISQQFDLKAVNAALQQCNNLLKTTAESTPLYKKLTLEQSILYLQKLHWINKVPSFRTGSFFTSESKKYIGDLTSLCESEYAVEAYFWMARAFIPTVKFFDLHDRCTAMDPLTKQQSRDARDELLAQVKKFLQKCVALDPNFLPAYWELAKLQEFSTDYDKAKSIYTILQEKAPDHALLARMKIAFADAKVGRYRQAIAVYEDIYHHSFQEMSNVYSVPTFLFCFAYSLYRLGEFSRATPLLLQAKTSLEANNNCFDLSALMFNFVVIKDNCCQPHAKILSQIKDFDFKWPVLIKSAEGVFFYPDGNDLNTVVKLPEEINKLLREHGIVFVYDSKKPYTLLTVAGIFPELFGYIQHKVNRPILAWKNLMIKEINDSLEAIKEAKEGAMLDSNRLFSARKPAAAAPQQTANITPSF